MTIRRACERSNIHPCEATAETLIEFAVLVLTVVLAGVGLFHISASLWRFVFWASPPPTAIAGRPDGLYLHLSPVS
jgi:hypothetical protein